MSQLRDMVLDYSVKMKDMEKALIFARKAIISKPCLSKPYARTAVVFYEMGKINQAIATINNF